MADLSLTIACYHGVSVLLNSFEVALPEGVPRPFPNMISSDCGRRRRAGGDPVRAVDERLAQQRAIFKAFLQIYSSTAE